MKALKKARAEYKKAVMKRDRTKEQLCQDERLVKECEAALLEAENNEYIGIIREIGITVEELMQIKDRMKDGGLDSVLGIREEYETDDEFIQDEC